MRLRLLGSPLRLDGVAPRVLSIRGLVSIALAQGGLRFRHLGVVAALGPLKSARVHLCAAMAETRARRGRLSPCAKTRGQDVLCSGADAGRVLRFKRRRRALWDAWGTRRRDAWLDVPAPSCRREWPCLLVS